MRVGYLGPRAPSATRPAGARAPRAPAIELVRFPTVYDTVMAVHEGAVDRALVPIENSLEGSVNATLDALAFETEDVVIVGEAVWPIRHCLIAREQMPLERDHDRRLPPAGQRAVRALHPRPAAPRHRRGRQLHRRRGAHRRRVRRAVGGAGQPPLGGALRLRDPARRRRGRRRQRDPLRLARARPAPRRRRTGRGRRRSCSGASARSPRAGSSHACRSSPSATST